MALDERAEDVRTVDVVMVRRWLFGLAAGALVALAVVYGVAVRTRWGQRLDAAALRGTQLLSPHDVRVAQSLHTRVDIAVVALLGGAVLGVAWLRGRRRVALGVVVMCVGSFATTEILKRVLARPRLTVVDSLKHAATYPSGHTTIAMALAAGAILVARHEARAAVALIAAIFAGTIGCSLVVTVSHRPSDIIGAAFVVTAWSAGVAALLVRAQPPRHHEARPRARLSPILIIAGVALAAVGFVSAVSVAVAIHHGHLDTIALGRAFTGAASAIFATTILCAGALTIALHDVDFDEDA